MKKNLKITLFALGALALSGMTSCSYESDPSTNSSSALLKGRAPKIVAYSGGHYWGQNDTEGTRGTDMNANMWNQDWDCPPRPAEDLTSEELAELMELFRIGHETHNNIVLPFENYYVQQIYKGQDSYNSHDRCYNSDCDHVNGETVKGSDHMNKLVAYNPHDSFDYRQEDNWQGAWYTTEYEHVNNFNSGTNNNYPGQCGCGKQHYKTTLMTGMPTDGINPETQFGYHETWGTAHDYNNYIIVEYKGYYYVGFDYEAHKYDQTTHNHGEGMDVERDWNFTDWIVRITPAYHKGQTPSDNPGGIIDPVDPTPDPADSCDHCDHPAHPGENCPDCPEGEYCNPGFGGDDMEVGDPTCDKCGHHQHGDVCPDCNDNEGCNEKAPANPAVTGDEVEINLTIEGEGNDVHQSHLSIHVRAATDVDVFIPCPLEYICPADDMAIVQKHLDELMLHSGAQVGGEEGVVSGMLSTMHYKIGNFYIEFYVEFVAAGVPSSTGEIFEEDGIHVWTNNIEEELINYLERNYGDGITFELWNYFNDDVTFEMLKPYFDRATVKFLDKEPDAYINAYNDTDSGEMYDRDCHVGIHDSQVGDYNDSFKGNHYNGSPYNDIYTNKNQSTTPDNRQE